MNFRASLLNLSKSLVPIVVLLLAWEAMSRSIKVMSIFVPPPSADLLSLYSGIVNLQYFTLTSETLQRMFTAYFLAALTAIPVGLFLGWNIRAYRVFEPLIEALRVIPSIAWIAPAIIFFGLSGTSVVFVTFYALFWLFLVFSLYGVLSIDKLALLSFKVAEAKRRDVFLKLIIPGSMVNVAAALRQGIAVAFIVTISGEMLLSVDGLGYYLLESERLFAYPAIYATLILLSILGYALTKVALLVEHRFTLRWAIESGIQTS